MLRTLLSCALLACLPLCAATPVPAEFQTIYDELARQLAATTITSGWSGARSPVLFGGEVTPASAYMAVLQPGYYRNSVTPFLDALQSLGDVRIVKINLHFPLLYPPFYASWPASGGMAAYTARLTFYQNLVTDLDRRGITIIVQSMAQGSGDFASTAADPLDLTGYYRTLSFDDYIAGRSAQVLAICRLLQPDYVNFDSEPDIESAKGQQPALDANNQAQFLANNLKLVTAIRDAVVNADPPIRGLHRVLRLAIGMGSWERYLPALVANFTGLDGIDVIDVHVHPINASAGVDYLANLRAITDAALAAGKSVGMDETSLYHESAAELGKLGAPEVEVRDKWSFWTPVDSSFLTLMMNFANFKNVEYQSFGFPDRFFAYLDYANTPACPTPPWTSCTVNQWDMLANQALGRAITSNPVPVSEAGITFKSLLAAQADVKATLVSAASFLGPQFAPESIVSLFGSHLAPGLGGSAKVTIQDSAGTVTPLQTVMIGPRQINGVVASGLRAGLATITVESSDGVISKGWGTVAPVAPGIFTNAGNDTAAAISVKTSVDGTLTTTPIVQCRFLVCTVTPIDLGTASDSVVLVLFGTGIRGASPDAVSVTLGGVSAQVLYSGPQTEFPGLDQINVEIPRSLAGRGSVSVQVTAAGIAANAVTIPVK